MSVAAAHRAATTSGSISPAPPLSPQLIASARHRTRARDSLHRRPFAWASAVAAPRVGPGVADHRTSPVGSGGRPTQKPHHRRPCSSRPTRAAPGDSAASARATSTISARAGGPWTGGGADLCPGFASAPDFVPALPLHRISSPSVFVCASTASIHSPSWTFSCANTNPCGIRGKREPFR